MEVINNETILRELISNMTTLIEEYQKCIYKYKVRIELANKVLKDAHKQIESSKIKE